jgi:hypothetical protein
MYEPKSACGKLEVTRRVRANCGRMTAIRKLRPGLQPKRGLVLPKAAALTDATSRESGALLRFYDVAC